MTALSSALNILSIQEKSACLPFEYGKKLLDGLDSLYKQIISDNPSMDTLQSLRKVLNETPFVHKDPKLNEVLRQIEQRVSVELAKRQMF